MYLHYVWRHDAASHHEDVCTAIRTRLTRALTTTYRDMRAANRDVPQPTRVPLPRAQTVPLSVVYCSQVGWGGRRPLKFHFQILGSN